MKVYPNLFGRVFSALSYIEFTETKFFVFDKRGDESNTQYSELTDLATATRQLFGFQLRVPIDSTVLNFSLLKRRDSEHAVHILEQYACKQLVSKIDDASRIYKRKTYDEYLRDSSIVEIEKMVSPIIARYSRSRDRWDCLLDERSLNFLRLLEPLMPLEQSKACLRERFESKRLKEREDFFSNIESNPLTRKQSQSVIRNNDLNLVLAAAGTGKTSVMVAKAIELIDAGVARSDEVLVLAFNNSAVRELKERVDKRGSRYGVSGKNAPDIFTFHSLGRQILKQSEIPVKMSRLADDKTNQAKTWVTEWLGRYIESSPLALRNFIRLSFDPVNPFDFKSRAEYEEYVRDNEYITLKGDVVKGYQEWLIANWLFEQGVEYEYEASYTSTRRLDVGFAYHPDFHFKDTDIYLEHFGIDREGGTRADIDSVQYGAGMVRKRQLHAESGTTLLETYHYDWTEDTLEVRLAEHIANNGISTHPLAPEELFDVLREQGFIDRSAERYLKCLRAMRAERLDRDASLRRFLSAKLVFAERYAELLGDLHDAYVAELKRGHSIDYDDMIIRSTESVEMGRYRPRWKHILVDEFQDISMARMTFLQSLLQQGPNPTLTAVGDDWQSIYRFAGGKLELTTRFDSLVGPHTLTKLERTFRYNSSIAKTAGTFVMQNPEQYRKEVKANEHVDKPQVHLLECSAEEGKKLEDRTLQIVEQIRGQDMFGSIAIVARYHYLLKAAKERIDPVVAGNEAISYWTFHRSKGLEADYCILIGFFQGKSGFPNSNTEDAVVEALLPSLDSFPHSEERRLLYVGLTRAKKKSFLIADAMAPSKFIEELLTSRYELQIESPMFEQLHRDIFKCSLCEVGFYKKYTGQYGEYYRCTTGKNCKSKPRVCDVCGSPSLDGRYKSICNNKDCRNVKPICESCGRPMTIRQGKYGPFLGCTGYGIPDDQCTNTRNMVSSDPASAVVVTR